MSALPTAGHSGGSAHARAQAPSAFVSDPARPRGLTLPFTREVCAARDPALPQEAVLSWKCSALNTGTSEWQGARPDTLSHGLAFWSLGGPGGQGGPVSPVPTQRAAPGGPLLRAPSPTKGSGTAPSSAGASPYPMRRRSVPLLTVAPGQSSQVPSGALLMQGSPNAQGRNPSRSPHKLRGASWEDETRPKRDGDVGRPCGHRAGTSPAQGSAVGSVR